MRGWPNSRIARRPPGPEHARELGQGRAPAPPRCGCRTRSWRVARGRRDSGMRVASPRTSRMRVLRPSARTFASPSRSISPAKSTPTTGAARRAARRSRPRDRAVPVHRSSTRAPACERERIHRAVPPAAIEAGTEHVIQQVVARRDRVEHARRCARASCRRQASSRRRERGDSTSVSPARRDTSSWAKAERREDLAGHEVGEVVERLRHLVERRHRRHDHRARLGAQHHVPQLRQAHRRLARDDDQRAAFLQHHVGGALDEVARQAVRDAGERLHRARHDRPSPRSPGCRWRSWRRDPCCCAACRCPCAHRFAVASRRDTRRACRPPPRRRARRAAAAGRSPRRSARDDNRARAAPPSSASRRARRSRR